MADVWRDSLDPDLVGSDRILQLHSALTWLTNALFYESQNNEYQMVWYSQAAAANIAAWRDSQGVENRWVNQTEWSEDRPALRFAMARVLEADIRYFSASDVDTLLAGAETALRSVWERHGWQLPGGQPR